MCGKFEGARKREQKTLRLHLTWWIITQTGRNFFRFDLDFEVCGIMGNYFDYFAKIKSGKNERFNDLMWELELLP